MRHSAKLPACLLFSLGLSLGAPALTASTPGSPYLGIVTRNAFGLAAPPTQVTIPPPAPLARVQPAGITTMLGDKRALLKVFLPALPPEPAKEVSCILTVGHREGPIEVLAIDVGTRSVTVNNSGTVQVLTLEKDSPRPQTLSPMPPPPTPMPLQAAVRR